MRAIVCAAALALGSCGQSIDAADHAALGAEQCEALIRAADARAISHIFRANTGEGPLVRRTDQKADLYVDRAGRIAVVGEVAPDYFDASKIRYVLTAENVMIADFDRSPNARLNDARRNVILGDNRLVCTLYD